MVIDIPNYKYGTIHGDKRPEPSLYCQRTPVPTTYRFCVLYLHFEGFLLKCFDRNNHLDLLTRATIRESKIILCSKALDTNSPPQVYNSACSKSLSRMRTMTLQNSRVVCGSQCSVCIARPQAPPKNFWAGPGDKASVCMVRLSDYGGKSSNSTCVRALGAPGSRESSEI